MEVQDKTKYRLACSIKKLMEENTLDKITVKEIVADCNMTRQTFYRNFKDKYDLVNWYFEKLCQKSFKQMGVSLSLPVALKKKFEFLKKESVFFSQAFQSHDYNSLITYDFNMILQFYTDLITEKEGKPLDADTQFLLEMYCKASIDMTVKWATTGMELEPEQIASLLIQGMPVKLGKYLLS